MKILQKGFNYSQDGPGNRLVYHTQGCNFRCKWCSNPESMAGTNSKDREMSPEEILDEAVRSRMMFFDNGGVTFTGGEPTLQFDELKKTLTLLHENGINTAIENNGSHPKLCELSPLIDFLIVDLKHYDPEEHKKWTGARNDTTVENIMKLLKIRSQLHIRIPLINHVNTDSSGFIKLFENTDKSRATFEVLKYHEFGKDKWTSPYEITDGFVSDELFNNFTAALKDSGFNIIKT